MPMDCTAPADHGLLAIGVPLAWGEKARLHYLSRAPALMKTLRKALSRFASGTASVILSPKNCIQVGRSPTCCPMGARAGSGTDQAAAVRLAHRGSCRSASARASKCHRSLSVSSQISSTTGDAGSISEKQAASRLLESSTQSRESKRSSPRRSCRMRRVSVSAERTSSSKRAVRCTAGLLPRRAAAEISAST